MLKPHENNGGYCITSWLGKCRLVHRVVVETFVGEIPSDMNVDHLNGVKNDNRLENLEVVTRSENQKRAYKLGLVKGCAGEENGCSSLSENDVLRIYDMVIAGKTNNEISAVFDVHPRYVSLVRHGKRWGHLFFDHNISKMADRQSFGKLTISFDSAMSLLDELVAGKKQAKQIAKDYGLHPTTISHIKRKKMWGDLWACHEQRAATTIERGL